MKKKMITDPMGQWKYPGKNTRIPSNNITMKGVNYPVLGVSNTGQEKMMYPGQEYIFPGADYVDEFPQMKRGGRSRGLVPMPKPSKKGLASKKYSRSLDATNKLFAENKLFEKPKSRKNKIFDPKAKYYQDGGVKKFFDLDIKPNIYTRTDDPGSQMVGANLDVSHKSGLRGSLSTEFPFMHRNIQPSFIQSLGYRKNYKNLYGDVLLSNFSTPGQYFNPSANLELGYQKKIGNNLNANVGIQNTMTPGSYFNPAISAGIKYGFEDGGYVDLELSDAEIAQYVKGGYVVEDISIPSLTRAQDGVIVDELQKPELIQVPRAKINVDPNLDRQSAAAIKKSEYKPITAEYKKIARPTANFIPAEEASDEMIAELRNSGYYPVKTESGDYEVFSNKDISNAILQKGLSPNEISANLKLGQAQDIKSNFQDVYNYANAAHAKRNKDKIDALINSGKTKDQAFAILQSQGEGDIKSLQQLYGNYADAVYQNAVNSYNQFLSKKSEKKKDNKDLASIEKNIDASLAAQEQAVANYDAEYEPILTNLEENIDWSNSLQPSETLEKAAGSVYNPITKTFTPTISAYDKNEAKKYNYIKTKEEVIANKPNVSYTEAELAKLILKNDNLTEDQKKQFLTDSDKFNSIYEKYLEYKSEPDIVQEDYGNTYAPKGEFKIFENGNASWTKGGKIEDNVGQPKYQSGRTDMLDKEWIKTVVGTIGLSGATQAAKIITKATPIASAPWLNIGNILTAKGVYDTGTKHIPDLINTVQEATSDDKGWTNQRISDAAYNTAKISLSGMLPFVPAKNMNAVKTTKNIFNAAENAPKVASDGVDPVAQIKFLNAVAGLSGYKKGGSKKSYIEMELSDKEIKDYIKKGYIIEEVN